MSDLNVIFIPSVLAIGAIGIILLDAFLADSAQKSYRLAILILILSMLSAVFLWQQQGFAFHRMIVLDSFSLLSTFLFCLAALITLLLSHNTPYSNSQFHCLILLTLIGM